jgi:membrane protein DedA with SNARE-associated domain
MLWGSPNQVCADAMEWFLQHLTNLSPASVYKFVAGVLLLCGLGMPIPEDLSLISGGYMAHLGVVNVHKMFLVCFASVLGGDTMAFFLGRQFGRRILHWGPARRVFTARKQLRVRAYFRKYGPKVIFIGRFLPGLRFSIYFSAGTLHVRPSVFFVYDALAALLSVPVLVYLAWVFGDKIDDVISWAHRSEWGILAVAAVAVGLLVVKISRRRRRARKSAETAPPAPGAGPVADAGKAE